MRYIAYLSLALMLSGCQSVEVDEHKHFLVQMGESNQWYECIEIGATRWYKVWESTQAVSGEK